MWWRMRRPWICWHPWNTSVWIILTLIHQSLAFMKPSVQDSDSVFSKKSFSKKIKKHIIMTYCYMMSPSLTPFLLCQAAKFWAIERPRNKSRGPWRWLWCSKKLWGTSVTTTEVLLCETFWILQLQSTIAKQQQRPLMGVVCHKIWNGLLRGTKFVLPRSISFHLKLQQL